jgi:hypothetical protein
MQSPSVSSPTTPTGGSANLSSSLKLKFKLLPKGSNDTTTSQTISSINYNQTESVERPSKNIISSSDSTALNISIPSENESRNANEMSSSKEETSMSPITSLKPQKSGENSLKIKIRWSSGGSTNNLPIPTKKQQSRGVEEESSSNTGGGDGSGEMDVDTDNGLVTIKSELDELKQKLEQTSRQVDHCFTSSTLRASNGEGHSEPLSPFATTPSSSLSRKSGTPLQRTKTSVVVSSRQHKTGDSAVDALPRYKRRRDRTRESSSPPLSPRDERDSDSEFDSAPVSRTRVSKPTHKEKKVYASSTGTSGGNVNTPPSSGVAESSIPLTVSPPVAATPSTAAVTSAAPLSTVTETTATGTPRKNTKPKTRSSVRKKQRKRHDSADDMDAFSFEGDESEDDGGSTSHHHAHEVRHYGTPPTFWRSIDPYFEPFTQADLDFVNPTLREQEDRHLFVIPPLGPHYSQLWAQGQDTELAVKHHAPLKKDLRTTATTSSGPFDANSELRAGADQTEEPIRCETLTSRILAALIEENILIHGGAGSASAATASATPATAPATALTSSNVKKSFDGRQTTSSVGKLNLLQASPHLNIHSAAHPSHPHKLSAAAAAAEPNAGPADTTASPPSSLPAEANDATKDATTVSTPVPNPLNLAVPPHTSPVSNYSHHMMVQIEERLKLELRALGLLDDTAMTHTAAVSPMNTSLLDSNASLLNSNEDDEIVRELKRLQQQLKTHLAATNKIYAQLYALVTPKIAEGEEMKRKTEEMLQLEQRCLSKLSSKKARKRMQRGRAPNSSTLQTPSKMSTTINSSDNSTSSTLQDANASGNK